MVIKKGDVYFTDIDVGIGSEQHGYRPVVVIQNDIGNKKSPTVIVAMITSSLYKMDLPTHVLIYDGINGLQRDSVVLLEQIQTIDKKRLKSYVGRLSSNTMNNIENALLKSFGINQNNER